MLYHVMVLILTGEPGQDVPRHVDRGLRREYGRARIRLLTVGAKIAQDLGPRQNHANVTLPIVEDEVISRLLVNESKKTETNYNFRVVRRL